MHDMYQIKPTSRSSDDASRSTDPGLKDCLVLDRLQIENAPLNGQITGLALVSRAEFRTDRTGRPYITMTLLCGGGVTVEARWWHFPYTSSACPIQGEVYQITGFVDTFNGERQLRITSAAHVPGADLGAFVKATRRPLSTLLDELNAVCSSLDDQMHALVKAALYDDILDNFCIWPAAHHRHGAVRHGLLAHSLRVAELVQRIADAYGVDGLAFDLPLAVTAALLHDIGKLRTLPPIAGTALPESSTYFDHVTLGVLAVQDAANLLETPLLAARLDNLLHAILAHHGRREWGAACEPHTVEAWLVHLADLAESRLWAHSNEEVAPLERTFVLVQSGTAPLPDSQPVESLLV